MRNNSKQFSLSQKERTVSMPIPRSHTVWHGSSAHRYHIGSSIGIAQRCYSEVLSGWASTVSVGALVATLIKWCRKNFRNQTASHSILLISSYHRPTLSRYAVRWSQPAWLIMPEDVSHQRRHFDNLRSRVNFIAVMYFDLKMKETKGKRTVDILCCDITSLFSRQPSAGT